MIRVDPAAVTTAPRPPAGGGTDAPAPAPGLIGRQLAMLTRLAEIGMEIAEAAGRQATGLPTAAQAGPQTGPEPGPQPAIMRDPALVYVRVARAVRLTIALQSRLMHDLAALGRTEALAEAELKSARRARVRQLVERAVEAERDGGEGEIEQRSWEARERLTEAELDAELEGLPFAEIVARICEDLGLSPERTARILAIASLEDGRSGAWRPHARHAEERPSGRVSKHARPRAPPH